MEEKRQHRRAPVNLSANCQLGSGESFYGIVKDVSIGGAFIECETVPAFGSKLDLVVTLPGANAESTLPAVVRWTKPGGFGVQFGLMGARDTHALAGLVRGT